MVLMVLSGASQSALIDRGGGLIYDDVLDITWLQDATYSITQYADSGGIMGDMDGQMTWQVANAWTEGLSYYDSVRDVTYNDWRLPTVRPVNGSNFDTTLSFDGSTDLGFARTTTDGTDGGWRDGSNNSVSEIGYMYYVNLANLGTCDPELSSGELCTLQSGWSTTIKNTDPFTYLSISGYWTGTEYNLRDAWSFDFPNGVQQTNIKFTEQNAWAVRDGDVGLVPVPSAVWLFGSGLIGLIGIAKRKKA